MCDGEVSNWYLVRTKPHKERWVRDRLSNVTHEAFLPMLRAKTRCFGRLVTTLKPLFPSYVFARFDLTVSYFDVMYAAGVHSLVKIGGEPLPVPRLIIEEIQRRGEDGIIEIAPPQFNHGQKISVVEGPFRGFDAIFDHYLSGNERVAILLDAIGATPVRVVLPIDCLAQ